MCCVWSDPHELPTLIINSNINLFVDRSKSLFSNSYLRKITVKLARLSSFGILHRNLFWNLPARKADIRQRRTSPYFASPQYHAAGDWIENLRQFLWAHMFCSVLLPARSFFILFATNIYRSTNLFHAWISYTIK